MELIYKKERIDARLEKVAQGYELHMDGESIPLDFSKMSENEFSITINGKKKSVYTAEDNNRIYVNIEGKTFNFDKPADDDTDFDSSSTANLNREEVKPPMPGTIVKVLVNKGAKVKEGDSLLIVEAMKMETTLYSSIEGIVTEINANEGTQADSEDILIVIEKENIEAA